LIYKYREMDIHLKHLLGQDHLVILSHGFCNDSSSNGRFDLLGQALNQKSYGVLSFDYPGCGQSQSTDIWVQDQVDLLRAMILYGYDLGYKTISLFGNSLGALICLKAYDPTLKTLVLTGPLTGPMNYTWSDYYSLDQLKQLEDHGYFYDGNHIISQRTLDGFKDIKTRDLMEAITCPLLMIHGNHPEDQEELDLLALTSRAVTYLSSYYDLRIIDQGKHGLRDHWDQVVNMTLEWLEKV